MIEQLASLRLANLRLSTGIRLHYAEQGDPDAHPLLLLHGLSDSWFAFSPILPALAARYRVFALDQRGHGDSDRPASGYAMADFAADAVAFMDAVGLPQATVFGHSMGSAVAIELAIRAPERVAGLVLIGANSSWDTPLMAEFQREVNALEDPVPAAFAREFQAGTALEPLPEAFLERVVAESLKLPARVWREALAGVINVDYLAGAGAIQSPAILLGGEQDAYCSAASQRELAARLGGAELKRYPGMAHCPHWEQPGEFLRDVEVFLRRATPR